MSEERCATCLYYRKDRSCHRRPPVVTWIPTTDCEGDPDVRHWTTYPCVSETDWCGEWRAQADSCSDAPETLGDKVDRLEITVNTLLNMVAAAKLYPDPAQADTDSAVTDITACAPPLISLDVYGRQRVVCPKCAREWLIDEAPAAPTDKGSAAADEQSANACPACTSMSIGPATLRANGMCARWCNLHGCQCEGVLHGVDHADGIFKVLGQVEPRGVADSPSAAGRFCGLCGTWHRADEGCAQRVMPLGGISPTGRITHIQTDEDGYVIPSSQLRVPAISDVKAGQVVGVADAASDDAPAQDDDATVPDAPHVVDGDQDAVELEALRRANAARPPQDDRESLVESVRALSAALEMPEPPVGNMTKSSLRVFLQMLQRRTKARDEQKSEEAAPADDSEGS